MAGEEVQFDEDYIRLVKSLLHFVGESPDREGLRETPTRFLKALKEKTKGYHMRIDNLTQFNSEGYDQMIVCDKIKFFSLCEHHLENFEGYAFVAYVPRKKIMGASKPARVVEMFSRRLQNQERITQQIATFLQEKLGVKDVAVILKGTHNCMRCRGVRQLDSEFTTSAMFGEFRRPEVKMEMFELIKLRGGRNE